MAKRRYNPSQKRDFHGRWTKGSAGSKASGSTSLARRSGVSSSTGNTRRYDAYLAKQASIKQAKRKSAIKKALVSAALVGATATGVYVGRRSQPKSNSNSPSGLSPSRSVVTDLPKRPVVGGSAPAKKVETSKPRRQPVSAKPAQLKDFQGAKVSLARSKTKANPTSSPAKTPAVTGVSTVKGEAALKKARAPKPKANPTSNPVPTPGALLTEDGKRVSVVRGLNDKERASLQQRAAEANRRLRELEKKAGVNVGAEERKKFDKANAGKRTKSEAATAREAAKAAQRRSDMSKAIQASAGATAMASKLSRRERAESRYVDILESMLAGGKALNRTQRKFLKDYGV